MSKTKDRILQEALTLFNEQGLAKVTLRTIAGEMGISQGNLNYHFKKREDIIESLYFRLVEQINEQMSAIGKESLSLQLIFDMTKAVMNTLAEYRFFMLDFVQIMRENDQISKHFRKLIGERSHQFKIIFASLVANGIMREEELPNEYEHFYTRIQMVGDYWISYAEVIEQVDSRKKVNNYIQMLAHSVYPYLTDKGKDEYKSLRL